MHTRQSLRFGVSIVLLGAMALVTTNCAPEMAATTDAAPDTLNPPDAPTDSNVVGDAATDALNVRDATATDADAANDANNNNNERDVVTSPLGPPLYPFETRHSPITNDLADGLRAVVRRIPARRERVFAKVGDSITATPSFMACFTGGTVDLGGRDALRVTIDHFAAGDAAGSDPFRRVSLAAAMGWSASRALLGMPSPLTQELDAIQPRFASLMYGTNDVGFIDIDTFGRNMTTLVDAMLLGGTIPILSSIPPRDDDATINSRVPVYNLLVRALAQSRRVPFVDFHRELLPLAAHGLAGDGVHPQSFMGGCVLTPTGLRAGANVRNLLVLEALDRLRRVVIARENSLDASTPRLQGSGTLDAPFVVSSLPFAAHGDTRSMGESRVDRWSGCSPANESGRELRFRFRLDAPARITAAVSSGAGADLDVHVVPAGSTGAMCIARDNRQVDVDLGAGEWDLVVDTFAGAAGPLAGEAFVLVLRR